MIAPWIGAVLGLAVGTGCALVIAGIPWFRSIRLVDRIGPYLPDAPSGSRLIGEPAAASRFSLPAWQVFGPALGEAGSWVDRLLGGADSVTRRLAGVGSRSSVEDFRVEQVLWGACGLLAGGVGAGVLGALADSLDPLLVVLAAVTGAVAGALGRDWWLSRTLVRRERTMMAELPVIADLLALAVTAGEAPRDAMERICRLTSGEVTRELADALAESRSGSSLLSALSGLAQRSTLDALTRFLDGLVVAVERGTPLAGVLRSQAADIREQSKRELLEAGGRKEIQMMAPVVFMVLPVTVVFALYPGLVSLSGAGG